MSSISLNIGLRALLTAQSALDTVGHNISNANTPGYSRQDLHVSARRPLMLRGLAVGNGVGPDVVLRTTDALLNRRIVAQLAGVSKLESSLVGMREVEALLGEPSGFGIGSLLDGLFDSMADLSSNTEDVVFRTGVTEAALSLTSQFHQLADGFDGFRADTAERLDSFTSEVNVLSGQILTLNQEIAKIEASGVVANDLRDQRDVALRKLAQQVDITYHEDQNGSVRVLVNGQLLVGATTTNDMYSMAGADGALSIWLEGTTKPVDVHGGEIGGLLAFVGGFAPGVEADLDALARSLILETNRVHSTGIPLSGGFTELLGESVITDVDDDGDLSDELLANAGLPFTVQGGTLYVNVEDSATGAFTTHTIDIDPARTTVGDLVQQLNGVNGISANVDTLGRLKIFAGAGQRFDFARRLNRAPDPIGSFGGGRASVGSGASGPFALADGDTLDLNGPLGPFTVTFDSADFADIDDATPSEIAAVLNNDVNFLANGLRAGVAGDQLVIQTSATGSAETFDVVGGSSLGALGLSAQTVTGHDTAVQIGIHGDYDGATNDTFVFRPVGDGEIGTTPGLQVEVLDSDGQQVALLNVGENYIPGTELEVADGVSVSFSYGVLSATNNDSFTEHVIADSDTTDVLVALGLNTLFTGSDAETIELRSAVAADPSLLAASATGSEGDNGALLDLLALRDEDAEGLSATLGQFYGAVIGGIGFDISSAENARQVEQYLVDTLVARREEVSGVNVDEELVDMIQHEQAFGAASQFIQVVNLLNDEILNLI